MAHVSLILPCQNESAAIGEMMARLAPVRESLADQDVSMEVIVVDDASTDGSFEMLSTYPGLKIVRNQCSAGYGGALKRGFAEARGTWIAFMDLDRTYRLEDLPNLLHAARSMDLDMAYGCRSFLHSGMPAIRGVGNFLFVAALKIAVRSSLSDVCTGFRVFHRRRLPEILALPASGLNFSLQLTALSVMKNWRIQEFNVDYEMRLGESKLHTFRDGFRFLWILLRARRDLP